MPEAATAEEIEKVYLEGWKLGLKAIAIYRDNSKRSPAAVDRQEEGRRRRSPTTEVVAKLQEGAREGPGRGGASRIAAASRPSATRSPTSSTSPATRATSRSGSTRTASRARSS